MKHRLNEKGMALITALLIIVIFSVIGMSLFNFTVSSAKQINKVELDMQATDVAEMGIVHYENALIVHFGKALQSKIEGFIRELEAANVTRLAMGVAPIKIDESTITAKLEELRENESFLNFNAEEIKPSVNSAYNYEISNQSDKLKPPHKKNLVVLFTSKGILSNGETATITAEVKFDLASIIGDALVSSGTGGGADDGTTNGESNNLTTITPPQKPIKPVVNGAIPPNLNFPGPLDRFPIGDYVAIGAINIGTINGGGKIFSSHIYSENGIGTFGAINGIEKSELYFKEKVEFNNEVAITDSTIYTDGTAHFKSTVKGLLNTQIFSTGNINFENAINSGISNNSIIYTKGHAKFNNIDGISNSKIYSENGLTLGTINSPGLNNATIYTAGSAKFSDINGTSNSKIYIEGALETGNINGSISDDSLICVGGTITGGLAGKENGVNIISKTRFPTQYAEKCLFNPSNNDSENTTPTVDLTELLAAISGMLRSKELTYH